MMNGSSTRRVTQAAATDDWSFSFRNSNADFYSDSESDSDTEPVVRDDPRPRLLNDFDLTSREETVLYRPNPFSIAKINAASRANNTVITNVEPTKEKPALKVKSTIRQNGNIIDGFKKQAERVRGRPFSVGTLKPGPLSSQGRAVIEPEGGVATKPRPLTFQASKRLLVQPSVSGKLQPVPSRMMYQETSTAIRADGGAPSPNVHFAQVSSVDRNAPLSPPPALGYGAPHHVSNFAKPAPHMPASTSMSISCSPKLRQGRTDTRNQIPVRQLAFPVDVSQSQLEPKPESGLLAQSTPIQSRYEAPPQFTAMCVPGLKKPKQYGGAFSSPILPPARKFLPLLQDKFHSSALVSPRTSIPMGIPFSSPLRPSDSSTNTPALHTLRVGASDSRAFPSRASNLARSSRIGVTRNGHGLQLPLRPRLGPPFKYDSQNMLRPRAQTGNNHSYTPTDGFEGNHRFEDQTLDALNNGDNDNDNVYMRVDSPNWTTPHKHNTISSLNRAVQAPPPMQSSQIEQEQGHAVHVYGHDDLEEGSDVAYPQTTDQFLNVLGSRPAARPQPQNDAKVIARLLCKRQRECSPSLPASPSPLSSPSPAPLRTPLRRSHNPGLNLNTKSKSKENDKIRNIDAYSFKGLNRHEAQDEEWSTLPARKKAKKTGVQALPGVKTSSKFKLPLALLAGRGLVKGEKDEECISTTSARRVVLFLPPPPRGTSSSAEDATRSFGEKENIAQAPGDEVRERREAKVTTPQTVSNPPAQSISCLSPIRQVFSPSSSPSVNRQAELSASELTPTFSPNSLQPAQSPLRRMEVKPYYRPLTPPTSDPAAFAGGYTIETGPECDDEEGNDHPGEGDIAIHIDVASIGLRYPIVKAYMRECRRLEKQAWDVLGLPSCGRVYCDVGEDTGRNEKEREIGIVIWPGIDERG